MDIPTEDELLQSVVAKVTDRIGIPVRVIKIAPEFDRQRVDTLVRIGRGKAAVTYTAEVNKGLRPATLGPILHQVSRIKAPSLQVADYATPPLAETLKVRGVTFLDAAGNGYIDRPPHFDWVKDSRSCPVVRCRVVAHRQVALGTVAERCWLADIHFRPHLPMRRRGRCPLE